LDLLQVVLRPGPACLVNAVREEQGPHDSSELSSAPTFQPQLLGGGLDIISIESNLNKFIFAAQEFVRRQPDNSSALTELSQSTGEPITILVTLLTLSIINHAIVKARQHNVEKTLNKYVEIQNEVLSQKVQRCVKARELSFQAKVVSFVIERTISAIQGIDNQKPTRNIIQVFKESLNDFQEASCGIEVDSRLSNGRQELEKQKKQMEGNVIKSMLNTLLYFFGVASALQVGFGDDVLIALIASHQIDSKWTQAFGEPWPSFSEDEMKTTLRESKLDHTAPTVNWKNVLKRTFLLVILSTLLVYKLVKDDPKLTGGISLIILSLLDLMGHVHTIYSTEEWTLVSVGGVTLRIVADLVLLSAGVLEIIAKTSGATNAGSIAGKLLKEVLLAKVVFVILKTGLHLRTLVSEARQQQHMLADAMAAKASHSKEHQYLTCQTLPQMESIMHGISEELQAAILAVLRDYTRSNSIQGDISVGEMNAMESSMQGMCDSDDAEPDVLLNCLAVLRGLETDKRLTFVPGVRQKLYKRLLYSPISDLAVAATQHDRQVLRSMNFEPIGKHLFACRSCSNWVITVPKQVRADAAAQCHTAQEIVHTLELPSLDPSSPSGFHSLAFCRKRRQELTPADTHSLWGLQQVSAKFVIWKSLSEIQASSDGIASIKEKRAKLKTHGVVELLSLPESTMTRNTEWESEYLARIEDVPFYSRFKAWFHRLDEGQDNRVREFNIDTLLGFTGNPRVDAIPAVKAHMGDSVYTSLIQATGPWCSILLFTAAKEGSLRQVWASAPVNMASSNYSWKDYASIWALDGDAKKQILGDSSEAAVGGKDQYSQCVVTMVDSQGLTAVQACATCSASDHSLCDEDEALNSEFEMCDAAALKLGLQPARFIDWKRLRILLYEPPVVTDDNRVTPGIYRLIVMTQVLMDT